MRSAILLAFLASLAWAQKYVLVSYTAREASIQDVVKSLASQAGLGYNERKSLDQTDQECRALIQDIHMQKVPFGHAMNVFLSRMGLQYTIENGAVVLDRALYADIPQATVVTEPPRTLITYSTGPKSVQYVVIDIARQAGLGYNWEQSMAEGSPYNRDFVAKLKVRNVPFPTVMEKLLKPHHLRYRINNGQVVLYRR